jgi:ferredoxin
MPEVVEELRALARDLLAKGTVKTVIGYKAERLANRVSPLIITSPDRAGELVWNKYCLNNLAVYLTRGEVMRRGPAAVVVKGCDARAVCGLLQEGQIARQNVVIIGMVCEGVGEPLLEMCKSCDVHVPRLADYIIPKEAQKPAEAAKTPAEADAEVARLEALTPEERWKFWREKLERCIKCYACRQACPLCYCKRCVVEKNQPQWISTSAHAAGNFAWNAIRAMHLAGRCGACGACERACPQGIPLMLLNKKMAKEVALHFNYRAGYDPAATPALRTFDARGDNDELFR